jgi:hypothetical protein
MKPVLQDDCDPTECIEYYDDCDSTTGRRLLDSFGGDYGDDSYGGDDLTDTMEFPDFGMTETMPVPDEAPVVPTFASTFKGGDSTPPPAPTSYPPPRALSALLAMKSCHK